MIALIPVALIVAMLLLNAVFVAAEFAMVGALKPRLRQTSIAEHHPSRTRAWWRSLCFPNSVRPRTRGGERDRE